MVRNCHPSSLERKVINSINNCEMIEHLSVHGYVGVCSIVMNHGQIHLMEQTDTHKIKSGQMCVSQHPSESGHFDPLDLFQGSNLGQSGLMGRGPGLSCTYHFAKISSGSWRTSWSSWANEPL